MLRLRSTRESIHEYGSRTMIRDISKEDNIMQSIFSSAARLRARGKQREQIVEPRR